MRIVMLLSILVASLVCKAQFKPYISVGSNLSANTLSYGLEAGGYTDKVWYSLAASIDQSHQKYGTIKAYYKLNTTGIVDVFGYGAVDVHLAEDKVIYLEPGAALVFNIWKKFAPQVSMSFPTPETTWRPSMSLGLSINYWIK